MYQIFGKIKKITATGIPIQKEAITRHPPLMTILPSFLSRPLLVKGIPMVQETLALAAETPKNRFQEKPPRFISFLLLQNPVKDNL